MGFAELFGHILDVNFELNLARKKEATKIVSHQFWAFLLGLMWTLMSSGHIFKL